MADLSKVGERERLRPRRGDEPHWHRLRSGCFVGYRPSKQGGLGTWFARAYQGDTFKYVRKPLGSFGGLKGNETFSAAKSEAEAWFDQVEGDGVRVRKIETVGDACHSYLEERPGKIAEGVLRRHVFSDTLAKVRLDKLRRHHLLDWRRRLENAPALISRSNHGERREKVRADSTVNRDMVPLRAALGRVMKPGVPNTESAWQEALRPKTGADKQRGLYLDSSDRKALLLSANDEIRPFLRALCLLPLRPGALANLSAGDFEKQTRTLTVGKDKNGQPRRISVPSEIAKFLVEQISGRLLSEPMFLRSNGSAWNKDSWKHPIKDAARSAGLSSSLTAYTLRHSIITDLIRHRLPALTVAQISGTSIAMIERHYGHLGRADAEDALAKLVI